MHLLYRGHVDIITASVSYSVSTLFIFHPPTSSMHYIHIVLTINSFSSGRLMPKQQISTQYKIFLRGAAGYVMSETHCTSIHCLAAHTCCMRHNTHTSKLSIMFQWIDTVIDTHIHIPLYRFYITINEGVDPLGSLTCANVLTS